MVLSPVGNWAQVCPGLNDGLLVDNQASGGLGSPFIRRGIEFSQAGVIPSMGPNSASETQHSQRQRLSSPRRVLRVSEGSQCIKKQRHHFANKGQSYGFPISHVWM